MKVFVSVRGRSDKQCVFEPAFVFKDLAETRGVRDDCSERSPLAVSHAHCHHLMINIEPDDSISREDCV